MKDLDLNDVRTFVAVAQAGTLTAAAKELQLPTSTVSRALTRLEQHLSVLLVQRSPRGLVLTDSGEGVPAIVQVTARDQVGSLRSSVPSPWRATC